MKFIYVYYSYYIITNPKERKGPNNMTINSPRTPVRRRGGGVITSPPVTPVRHHRRIQTPLRPVRVRIHGSGILDVVRVRGRRILSPVMNFGSPRERARDLAPVLQNRENKPRKRRRPRIGNYRCPVIGQLDFNRKC